MGVLFDKLSFMKRLEGGGTFTRPQAEALSEAFHEAVAESVATKEDLGEVRHETAELRVELKADVAQVRHEVSELRTELRAGLSELRTEMNAMRSDSRAAQAETKVWTVSVGASIVAVLAAIKYFG